MHAFTNIIAASSLIASISASPLLIARDTCGSAPSGSGSQTPLSQPTGIQTASACEAQCEANSACQSFVFGMVNNAIECILYSVAASSVPSQGSSNLVVYDKTCSSIPAVVPTTSNPTGAATSSSNTGSNTGSTTGNGAGTSNGAQNHKRDTCGTSPTGTSSQAPLSTPAGITTAAACQAQCDANSACQSFVFGMVNNADQCILYSVAAASVPTQTSTNLVAYDKTCASVPTQTPTASNPTGANTGSSSSSGSTGSTGSTGSSGSTTGSNTGSAGNGASKPAKA